MYSHKGLYTPYGKADSDPPPPSEDSIFNLKPYDGVAKPWMSR